jgi:hypothetical protein
MPSAELDGWFATAENDPSNLPRSSRVRSDAQRFQIHAGVRVAAADRTALERLCAYVARPPLADEQLRRLADDRVELTLRNAQRGPKTTVVLHPLQLIRRLAIGGEARRGSFPSERRAPEPSEGRVADRLAWQVPTRASTAFAMPACSRPRPRSVPTSCRPGASPYRARGSERGVSSPRCRSRTERHGRSFSPERTASRVTAARRATAY